MIYLKEFYWKNEDSFELTPYGRLITSFKNDEDKFWLIRPLTEDHQAAIYNLNHKKNPKLYAEIHNKHIPHSSRWANSFVYLTESESSLYKVFLGLKSNSYPAQFNVKPNQADTIIKDVGSMLKDSRLKIVPASEDDYYRQLFDPSFREFTYKDQRIVKEALSMESHKLKSIKEYGRVFV